MGSKAGAGAVYRVFSAYARRWKEALLENPPIIFEINEKQSNRLVKNCELAKE